MSSDEARRLIIVGCGAAKRDAGQPYPAKELYSSTYFQKKREFAEACGDQWMILSAEHGLVSPTADLRPYETSIDDLDDDEIAHLAHEVNETLTEWIADTESRVAGVEEIVVLAGTRYVDPLCRHEVFTAGVEPTVVFPFQEEDLGGIGEQMAWLDARADGHEQTTLMTDGGQSMSDLPSPDRARHYHQVPWYLGGAGAGVLLVGLIDIVPWVRGFAPIELVVLGSIIVASVMLFMVISDE